MELELRQPSKISKIRTKADRLEEERKKQEELMQKQKEEMIEKVRMLRRYIISKASEQEKGKTEASISLSNEEREMLAKKMNEPKVKTNSENVLTILDKIEIKPAKKKIIKHYMLNKLKGVY